MKKLEIEFIDNYYSFKKGEKLSFEGRFIILSGLNGSGKTQLLNAMAKPYEEQILGIWELTVQNERTEPSVYNIEFHDDGTVSRQLSEKSYDYYSWTIVDENTLKIIDNDRDWFAMYEIEINGKEMTLVHKPDSEYIPFGSLTSTGIKKD